MPERPGRGGGGADARPRGPDGLAVASRGLGGRARHGAARRRAEADGRPLRDRRARRSCSPTSMPADSERRPPHAGLPHTWRPFGVRIAVWVLGGDAARPASSWSGSALDAEVRGQFTTFQRGTLVLIGLLLFAAYNALVRSRVSATDDRADGGQRLPQADLRVVPGDRGVAAPRGALGDPGPLRRHHGLADRRAGLRRRAGTPGGPGDPGGDRGEHARLTRRKPGCPAPGQAYDPGVGDFSTRPVTPTTRVRSTTCWPRPRRSTTPRSTTRSRTWSRSSRTR